MFLLRSTFWLALAGITALVAGCTPRARLIVFAPAPSSFYFTTDRDSGAVARRMRHAEQMLWLADLDSAASVYLPLFPDSGLPARRQIHAGLVELREGRNSQAEERFLSAQQSASRSPWPYYLYGLAIQGYRPGAALRSFETANIWDPRYLPARLAVARQHLKSKQYVPAERAYRMVVSLKGDHPTASYELGLADQRGHLYSGAASSHFERQLEANPSHGPSLTGLGVINVLARRDSVGREYLLRALSAREPDSSVIYPALAASFVGDGMMNLAAEAFDSAWTVIPPSHRTVYENVDLITSPGEARQPSSGSVNRSTRADRVWARLDPTPITLLNERRLEHYRRVWLAIHQFGRRRWPWDARGDLYIRWGEPDFRSTSTNPNLEIPPAIDRLLERWKQFAGDMSTYRGHGKYDESWEMWVYKEVYGGIRLDFVDQWKTGLFEFMEPDYRQGDLYAPELIVSRAAESDPEQFVPGDTLKPLDFYYDVVQHRGDTTESVVEIYYGLPTSKLAFEPDGDRQSAQVTLGFTLHDNQWGEVERRKDRTSFEIVAKDSTNIGRIHLDHKRLVAPSGEYNLSVQATDTRSGRTQVYREKLSIAAYDRPRLAMSDVIMAAAIDRVPLPADDRFVIRDLRIIPIPNGSLRKGQTSYVYFEIYHLVKNRYGATSYETDYAIRRTDQSLTDELGRWLGAGKDPELGIGSLLRDIRSTAYRHFSLDTASLEVGTYELRVTVDDHVSGRTINKAVPFHISE